MFRIDIFFCFYIINIDGNQHQPLWTAARNSPAECTDFARWSTYYCLLLEQPFVQTLFCLIDIITAHCDDKITSRRINPQRCIHTCGDIIIKYTPIL